MLENLRYGMRASATRIPRESDPFDDLPAPPPPDVPVPPMADVSEGDAESAVETLRAHPGIDTGERS